MDDLISRQQAIYTDGLDEEIRCEMCRNPMNTDRGCDGHCEYDEKLYERIMQILDERITPLPSADPEQESFEWCHDCKEYDQAQHCCHRWTKTIRKTVDELKQSAKQGAWQQCHITTPTGGQHCVWECDGCGARVAERTKYCAECGRRMTG